MFDKITNYLDTASNNIKVASAKMKRHSEEMVIRAEDSFFEEFGMSIEEHNEAQVAAKALPKPKAKAEKEAHKMNIQFDKAAVKARVKAKPVWSAQHRKNNPYNFNHNELS